MGGNQAKFETDLFIAKIGDRDHVIMTLFDGSTYFFPFEYLVFGSKTSQDCDMIMNVPLEFTKLKLRTDTYNSICAIMDKKFGPIIGTNKVINSSLGHWHNGRLLWAQKGSDVGEVNNSLMSTFNNHIQMYKTCPITTRLERNIKYKIITTIRDVLCKMNKTRFVNDDLVLLCKLIVGILNIPEIHKYSKGEMKTFVCSILRGVFINKPLSDELCSLLPDLSESITSITATAPNKKLRLIPMDNLVTNLSKGLDITDIVMSILEANVRDGHIVATILDALSHCNNIVLRDEFIEATGSGVTRLNRLLRLVRRIQLIGVRIDILRLLDWQNIIYTMDISGQNDRYKDIAFKMGQACALMDGIELFDKAEIATRYPELAVFLWRREPIATDLEYLTVFVNKFLDRVESYPGYSRDWCEEYRTN